MLFTASMKWWRALSQVHCKLIPKSFGAFAKWQALLQVHFKLIQRQALLQVHSRLIASSSKSLCSGKLCIIYIQKAGCHDWEAHHAGLKEIYEQGGEVLLPSRVHNALPH